MEMHEMKVLVDIPLKTNRIDYIGNYKNYLYFSLLDGFHKKIMRYDTITQLFYDVSCGQKLAYYLRAPAVYVSCGERLYIISQQKILFYDFEKGKILNM